MSYDYGTTFTHISDKFQLSADREGMKQVISQFYHSPADNKRVSVEERSFFIQNLDCFPAICRVTFHRSSHLYTPTNGGKNTSLVSGCCPLLVKCCRVKRLMGVGVCSYRWCKIAVGLCTASLQGLTAADGDHSSGVDDVTCTAAAAGC